MGDGRNWRALLLAVMSPWVLLLDRYRGSSVSIVTRLRTCRPGFDSREDLGISLRHRVQTGPEAHKASYPMEPRVLSPVVNRPGCEANHSLPSNAEVKNAWSYTSTSSYVFMTKGKKVKLSLCFLN
jgi:hypothetical protein